MKGARVGTLIAGALVLAGCGALPFGGDTSPSPSPSSTATMPTSACAVGDSVTPPDISDLSINGVPAAQWQTPLVVPYDGLEGGTKERPSVLRVEVVTSTSGSPVTFRTTGAQIIDTLASTVPAKGEITVFSQPGMERCVAVAYIFSTVIGEATINVQGLNSEAAKFRVITTREAARNIALDVSSNLVNAGDPVDAVVGVTDVFGNPIENASVDLVLPAKGAGLFDTGANTFTVLTDEKGRASVQVRTRAGFGTKLTVTAKGDLASCLPMENQYACKADQPVPDFEAASGPQKEVVNLTEPKVTITSPPAGTAYSTGEVFDIAGKATGVKEGTTARLLLGDNPLGASTVKADGTFAFTNVPAQSQGSGDLGYVVIVGDLKPQPVEISVKTFTIVSFKRVSSGLKFRVTPGAWKQGTLIELTRDGAPTTKIEVTDPGKDLYIFAPDVPGFYQVQVSTSRGIVYGEEVQAVL